MDGQMTLFDGKLTNFCEVKPEIGSRLVFKLNGVDYPCTVETHCGYDFFWVRFTDRTPHDDDPTIEESDGWHLSLRGYGKNWWFAKE